MYLGHSNNGYIRDLNFVYFFGGGGGGGLILSLLVCIIIIVFCKRGVDLFFVGVHNYNCVLQKYFL